MTRKYHMQANKPDPEVQAEIFTHLIQVALPKAQQRHTLLGRDNASARIRDTIYEVVGSPIHTHINSSVSLRDESNFGSLEAGLATVARAMARPYFEVTCRETTWTAARPAVKEFMRPHAEALSEHDFDTWWDNRGRLATEAWRSWATREYYPGWRANTVMFNMVQFNWLQFHYEPEPLAHVRAIHKLEV